MGNLVFQATLGGQVNLVGPNTASTYNLNVPAVAGTLVTTGDTGSVSSTMLASSLSLTTPNINVATGTSLKVTSGFYSTSSSAFTYTDGIVMDYTTGLGRISVGTSDGLAFYNAGVATTELMRLDASGNLGLGVTPSATSQPALEICRVGNTITSLGSNEIQFSAGAYNNSGWKYAVTGSPVTNYYQSAGAHYWRYAASGTAGNAITWSNGMTMDTSGNVGIGTSSPNLSGAGNGKFLAIVGAGATTTAASGRLELANPNAAANSNECGAILFEQIGNNSDVRISSIVATTSGSGGTNGFGGYLAFSTKGDNVAGAPTERARIDSSGNLLVGTTSSGASSQGFSLYASSDSVFRIGHASGTGTGSNYVQFNYNAGQIGSISQNGTTGVLYNLTSDYRLKNDPQPLTGAKEFVMALQPKKWQWWDGSGEGVGFIAHEFMEVAKYSGHGEKDAVDENGNPVYQSIQPSSSEVMANLVSFIQEQQAMISSQVAVIEALRADVEQLKAPQ